MRVHGILALAALAAGVCRATEPAVRVVSVEPAGPLEGERVVARVEVANVTSDVLVVGWGRDHGDVDEDAEPGAQRGHGHADYDILFDEAQCVGPGVTRAFDVPAFAVDDVPVRVVWSRHAGRTTVHVPQQGRFRRATLADVVAGRAGPEFILSEPMSASTCMRRRPGEIAEARVPARVATRPRPFALAAARSAFGAPTSAAHWSDVLEGWVLEGARRAALVRAAGVVELPPGALRLVQEVERPEARYGISVELADCDGGALATELRAMPGKGGVSLFLGIERGQLRRALELAQRDGLQVVASEWHARVTLRLER